jgi:hypothetical protein
MTRFELLWLLLGQARANGFEFRRWYVGRLGLPWQNARHAVETLAAERRYYALLFSHEFALHFWRAGEKMTFVVEKQTFQRTMPDGSIATVHRKAYTRRSGRQDAWRYHLKELAVAEEPLRYMRRYLRVEDELDAEPAVDFNEEAFLDGQQAAGQANQADAPAISATATSKETKPGIPPAKARKPASRALRQA